MADQTPTGFKDLLIKMMSRRWYITAMVLGGFLFIIAPQSKHNRIISSLKTLKHVEIDFEPIGTRTLLVF